MSEQREVADVEASPQATGYLVLFSFITVLFLLFVATMRDARPLHSPFTGREVFQIIVLVVGECATASICFVRMGQLNYWQRNVAGYRRVFRLYQDGSPPEITIVGRWEKIELPLRHVAVELIQPLGGWFHFIQLTVYGRQDHWFAQRRNPYAYGRSSIVFKDYAGSGQPMAIIPALQLLRTHNDVTRNSTWGQIISSLSTDLNQARQERDQAREQASLMSDRPILNQFDVTYQELRATRRAIKSKEVAAVVLRIAEYMLKALPAEHHRRPQYEKDVAELRAPVPASS